MYPSNQPNHCCVSVSVLSELLQFLQIKIPKKKMILSSTVSPFPSKTHNPNFRPLFPAPTHVLPNSMLPGFDAPNLKRLLLSGNRSYTNNRLTSTTSVRASLSEPPLLWAARICVYYALLKSGLAGSPHNPFLSDLKRGGSVGVESGDLGFSEWLGNMFGKPDREASDRRKLVSKWHPTVKGTLRRNYRVNSKSEGRRLLKAIASLLSDDDHFLDASSHKGCQIRRESAHGESVCCNNVRALFDELPTPHIVVEITAFPAGPLGENDYIKAEKLERVLRSSPNI